MLIVSITKGHQKTGVGDCICVNGCCLTVVEMGPGSVLSGLVKRIAPQLATLACGAPADIDRVIERVHAN